MEGTSVIVHGRLKVDQFTNNRGQRQTSLGCIAQRIRLAAQFDVEVREQQERAVNEGISAEQVTQGLRAHNLLEGMCHASQYVFGCIHSNLYIHANPII